MIDGIVSEPTFVRVDGTVHTVWRVATNRKICNVDCELGKGDVDVPIYLRPWKPHQMNVPYIQGELCEGPESCISCIAARER